MDEQPRAGRPRQRPAATPVPRSRLSEPAFTPPAAPSTQPEPSVAPRPVPKAVPAVVFKPPTVEEIPVLRHPDAPAEPEDPSAEDATPPKEPTPPAKASAEPAKPTAKATKAAAKPADKAVAKPVKKATARKSTTTKRTTRTPVTVQLLDRPAYAPELLALAAVDTLGASAQAWVGRVRAVYPSATPDGLARLATQQSVRLGTAGGAASAAAGLFAPLAGFAVLALTHAGMVLRLAAAYGLDPTHPDRAVDLLVLTRVHPDDESARAALAAAQSTEPEHLLHRVTDTSLRRTGSLAALAGGWLSVRLASRLLPGAALVAAVAGGSAATERLAARAVARYRQRQSQVNHSSGSRA